MCFVEESDQFKLFVCFVGLLGRFQSLFVDHCQLGLRKNTIQLVTAFRKRIWTYFWCDRVLSEVSHACVNVRSRPVGVPKEGSAVRLMNFFCYVYLVSAGRRWVCMRLRLQFRCAQERAAHRLKHSGALIEFVELVQSHFRGFTIQLRSRWRVVRIEISSELGAVIFQCD